jgi:hypothetical protein
MNGLGHCLVSDASVSLYDWQRDRRLRASSLFRMLLPIRLHHLRGDIFRVAERRFAAFAGVGAAAAAAATAAIGVVGAGAVAGVGGDGFVDQELLDLRVAERLFLGIFGFGRVAIALLWWRGVARCCGGDAGG